MLLFGFLLLVYGLVSFVISFFKWLFTAPTYLVDDDVGSKHN